MSEGDIFLFSITWDPEEIAKGIMPGVLLTQLCTCGHPECLESAASFIITVGASRVEGMASCVLLQTHSQGAEAISLSNHSSLKDAVDNGFNSFLSTFISMGYHADKVLIARDGWRVVE